MASEQPPEWLDFRLLAGNLTLNGSSRLRGYFTTPFSKVTINGQSVLEGGLLARELLINSGGVLRLLALEAEENRAPAVELVSPVAGQVLAAPATLRVRALASDPDGDPIALMRFWRDEVLLATLEAEPFEIELSSLAVGTYRFRATATDANGSTGESETVVVSGVPPFVPALPYVTDFESREGYGVGPLGGQQGWRAEGDVVVSDADAVAGTQAVLVGGGGRASAASLVFDPVAASQVVYWTASMVPVAGDDSATATVVRFGGVDLRFLREGLMGVWQATLPGGLGAVPVTPGLPLDASRSSLEWIRIGIRADYLRREWDLILNGRLVAYGLKMTVDPVPEFAGFEVSAGAGSSATLLDRVTVNFSAPWFQDADHDGMDDVWEETNGLDRSRNDRDEDLDGDDLTNIEEFLLGLTPNNPDTDGDGLYDGDEQLYGWGASSPTPDNEAPSPPAEVNAATVGVDRVTLTWAAADDNLRVAGYLVYRDGEAVDTAEAIRGTTFTDEGLVSGETYYYAVQSFDFAGNVSATTDEIEVTTLAEDEDADGLPDTWENRFFFEEAAGPDDDPDGDGLSNLAEYQAGSHPKDFFNGVLPTLSDPHGGTSSPEDTLVIEVRRPDGTPWEVAPVTFVIDEGSRRISADRESSDYATKVRVRANADGVAVVYLEPLTP